MWNLLLDVRGFTEESLSQPAVTAQHKARPTGALQGSLNVKEPPLKGVTPHGVGRCPQGRGDRSVRGGPPLGGGEVFS